MGGLVDVSIPLEPASFGIQVVLTTDLDPECMHDVGPADGYLRLRHLTHVWAGDEARYRCVRGGEQVERELCLEVDGM